jgi:class 3 adenylate cyclase
VRVQPETRYARSGNVNIAYQVVGDGLFDLVLVPPFVTHVELAWDVPGWATFYRRLASFSRLILFDKRGTGMSDRVSGVPTLETRMDDVRSVMDGAGSDRAALIGFSEGGPMSILFAATYPERVWALVLHSSYARHRWAADYPWGSTDEDYRHHVESEVFPWGTPEHAARFTHDLGPSLDEEDRRSFATLLRQGASPGAVEALYQMNRELDVRSVLPAIRTPTLVFALADHPRVIGHSRYLTERIIGARYAELAGTDHAIFAGDTEPFLEEVERFLAEAWEERAWQDAEPDRVLATVLFTDIVGATAKTAELGDTLWRELLEAHDARIRRLLARFRGTELDTAGDGFFASFDGPARAIRCACAISQSMRDLGLEVRAGLHTGECERMGEKVGGIAVHIGARVAAEAGPNEVLVSSTVRDLVAGSNIVFGDRGATELKGVPGEVRLFVVERAPSS